MEVLMTLWCILGVLCSQMKDTLTSQNARAVSLKEAHLFGINISKYHNLHSQPVDCHTDVDRATYNMPLAKHNTYAVCHVTLRHLNKTGLCTLNRAQTIAVPLHTSQKPACSSDSWDCCLQQILSAYHSCSEDGSLL